MINYISKFIGRLVGFGKEYNFDNRSIARFRFIIRKLIKTIQKHKPQYQELSLLEEEIKYLVYSYKDNPPVVGLEKVCYNLKECGIYSFIIKQLYEQVKQDMEALKERANLDTRTKIYLTD